MNRKITETPKVMRKFGKHWLSVKSGPKLGWKTSFTFEVVGHIFVLGLYNIIGGEEEERKEEKNEEEKQ